MKPLHFSDPIVRKGDTNLKLTSKNNRKSFTMIELIFVIVIMGFLGKFGVEFLFQAYDGYIKTKIFNDLQSNSSSAVEYVSNKLKNRIKSSTIVREEDDSFEPLDGYDKATANIIEWIGADIESFRGIDNPYWSGVLDLSASDKTKLVPLNSDLDEVDDLIQILSDNNSTIDDAAIYFIGSNSLSTGASAPSWGWDGNTTKFDTQTEKIHPIVRSGNNFAPANSAGDTIADGFNGVTAFEYYQLAWTAYAIGIDDYNNTTNAGTLTLWYGYQPWKGHSYRDANKKIAIMRNVSTFQFLGMNSLIKIQVCTKSLLIKDEEYSICKEKTIF